jgi:hypothetical protein
VPATCQVRRVGGAAGAGYCLRHWPALAVGERGADYWPARRANLSHHFSHLTQHMALQLEHGLRSHSGLTMAAPRSLRHAHLSATGDRTFARVSRLPHASRAPVAVAVPSPSIVLLQPHLHRHHDNHSTPYDGS